jgi:hypothetical protein
MSFGQRVVRRAYPPRERVARSSRLRLLRSSCAVMVVLKIAAERRRDLGNMMVIDCCFEWWDVNWIINCENGYFKGR